MEQLALFPSIADGFEEVDLEHELVQLLQADVLMDATFPVDTFTTSHTLGSKDGYASSSPCLEYLADADSMLQALVKNEPSCARVVTTVAQPDQLFLNCVHTLAGSSPTASAHDSHPFSWSKRSSTPSSSGHASNSSHDDLANISASDHEQDHQEQGKVNKRKAPEIDWRSIEDPAERRRQRRLAKNRVTAARSRERKKVQFGELELRLQSLESENVQLKELLQQCMHENSLLRTQLSSGAKRHHSMGGRAHRMEPTLMILLATLLVSCCVLPAHQAAMLSSCLPLVLVAQAASKLEAPISDLLLELLAATRTLISNSKASFRKAINTLLYTRVYVGHPHALMHGCMQVGHMRCAPKPTTCSMSAMPSLPQRPAGFKSRMMCMV